MPRHHDELVEKRQKLDEMRRQREMRARQLGRQSTGISSHLISPTPGRADRREIESLINSLVGDSRPVSTSTGAATPAFKGSRPNSVLNAGELSNDGSDYSPSRHGQPLQIPPTLSTIPLATVYEYSPSPVKETFSYSKAVQTSDDWPLSTRPRAISFLSEPEDASGVLSTPMKKQRRRERDREEGLRQTIRHEIEEELKNTRDLMSHGAANAGPMSSTNYPMRDLTSEELHAVTSSEALMDFVERSTKVIERALDLETYDILADYARQGRDPEDDDTSTGNVGGKGRRRVKEVGQFFDERWSRKRMITSIEFSPKFPELVLASYTKNPSVTNDPDGLVQVWNMHMHDQPEFVFSAQSDVLSAKFSPFHPNLIIGGSYSGQVLLWDTRSKSAPVQKTPLGGQGHTHPIYSVNIVGTQNANNIISCSTDGVVCGWSVDVFAQPQEKLTLRNPIQTKVEDVSPTCLAFPQSDPTFFIVGTEEGTIYPCHRYDRAGAKAGVDQNISYKGHTAPVMSVDFHPVRGPTDFSGLVLSSSLDWTVKLWKVRAPSATSTASASEARVSSLLEFVREDLVYDVGWSPIKPSVFAVVDGAGWLELWDLVVETEEPVARITPTMRAETRPLLTRSLNKVAWEQSEGKRLAVGGIDGNLTLFEVSSGLGGKEDLKAEDWVTTKKVINKLETVGSHGTYLV